MSDKINIKSLNGHAFEDSHAREAINLLKEEIPNIPESSDPDMYLVTDKDGNRAWEKKLAYVQQEEQLIVAETVVTSTGVMCAPFRQLVEIEAGNPATITCNGITYETVAFENSGGVQINAATEAGMVGIVFYGVGKEARLFNMTGAAITLSVTAVTNKYYPIDPNLTPTRSEPGTGHHAVIVTPNKDAEASGNYSVSVGNGRAQGTLSFATNYGTSTEHSSFSANSGTANGWNSAAFGTNTIANGESQFVEGKYNIEDTEEKYAHIVGNGYMDSETYAHVRSNAHTLDWEGNGWFAGTVKVGGTGQDDETAQEVALKSDIPNVPESSDPNMYLVTDKNGNRVWSPIVGKSLEGQTVYPTSDSTGVVAGEGATITGDLRERTYYQGIPSAGNIATGQYAHAEGQGTTASGEYSHAEGMSTTASSYSSHAEGRYTTASGDNSHAEGNGAIASGDASHAEGNKTTASGPVSHAEGNQTTASRPCSHAEGYGTIAASNYQHVEGQYNIKDTESKYAHIVGNGNVQYDTNGTPTTTRSNAHTLDWDGTAWFANTVKVGGTGQDDEAAQEVALKSDVPSLIPVATADTLGGVKVGDGLEITDGALGVKEKKYELIETITTTGESIIERTASPDGISYNFRRLLIHIGTTTNATETADFSVFMTYGDYSPSVNVTDFFISGKHSFGKVEARVENGALLFDVCGPVAGAGAAGSCKSMTITYFNDIDVNITGTIILSRGTLPSGTEISIYGIRA